MSATKTQKRAIDFLIEQLKELRNSNDLHSPSHYTEMSEAIAQCEDDLTEEQQNSVEGLAGLMFHMISSL